MFDLRDKSQRWNCDEVVRWPVDLTKDPLLEKSFDILRAKWSEVPYGVTERTKTTGLLSLSAEESLREWTEAHLRASAGEEGFSGRGWYQLLYKDSFRGKKILDVGCGMGLDTVLYAENGAHVTFLDIVPTNLQFVKRVCEAKRLKNVDFCYVHNLGALHSLPRHYDVIYCQGSLPPVPAEVARIEARALLEHLPAGGRWMALCYPRTRWEREGRVPFHLWGQHTDGWAPWMEWHDLAKIQSILSPAMFDVVLALEFHNSDFVWFDLVRRS